MAKYCIHCGNPVSPEEKFCKQCGTAVYTPAETNAAQEPQKTDITARTYEFSANKATFKFTSTPIHTTVTLKDNILHTSTECKSRMLCPENLNGQVNVSDICSVKYNRYASIAVFDLFLFGILFFVIAIDASYFIPYSLISGFILWRTLVPSLEITTKDHKKINILFSPRNDKAQMLRFVSDLTGKEFDANSDFKIPFSKKPFVVILIYLVVGFILTLLFS